MGTYSDRWKRRWGSFFSRYKSYYEAAAGCKDLDDPMARIDCAVEKMKELKRARMGAGGKGGA